VLSDSVYSDKCNWQAAGWPQSARVLLLLPTCFACVLSVSAVACEGGATLYVSDASAIAEAHPVHRYWRCFHCRRWQRSA
jgi:hypothetical protein